MRQYKLYVVFSTSITAILVHSYAITLQTISFFHCRSLVDNVGAHCYHYVGGIWKSLHRNVHITGKLTSGVSTARALRLGLAFGATAPAAATSILSSSMWTIGTCSGFGSASGSGLFCGSGSGVGVFQALAGDTRLLRL